MAAAVQDEIVAMVARAAQKLAILDPARVTCLAIVQPRSNK
jgi:hypothetical protein